MANSRHPRKPVAPKASPSPFVEVTILFRDTLQKPIEGLSVLVKAGAGAPQAPEWKLGYDSADPPAANPASAPGGASAPAPDASATLVSNRTEVVTDASGYAVTIQNAARNQPVDIGVKNRRGKYAWKATVTPKKDVSAFTIVSPEYHLEATTKLTPKDELEQDLDLPVIKEGEVMTIERLVNEFGPYIGWSQKVTEQGQIKRDFPTRKKDATSDKKTTQIAIEHHYKVVDTGKPRTITLNVLGSRLNYPATEITEIKYSRAAKKLGCEVAAIKAVAMTESHGAGFCDNGLPKILYERQIFFRSLLPKEKRNEKPSLLKRELNPFPKEPNLCLPIQGGYTDGKSDESGWSHSDENVMHQYERFIRACSLNRDAAIMACSWGAFQVLAFFYEEMGYSSPLELANLQMQGIDEQFDLFVAYVNMNNLAKKALQNKNWEDFSYYYNGSGYPPKYPSSMKEFYEKFK